MPSSIVRGIDIVVPAIVNGHERVGTRVRGDVGLLLVEGLRDGAIVGGEIPVVLDAFGDVVPTVFAQFETVVVVAGFGEGFAVAGGGGEVIKLGVALVDGGCWMRRGEKGLVGRKKRGRHTLRSLALQVTAGVAAGAGAGRAAVREMRESAATAQVKVEGTMLICVEGTKVLFRGRIW